MRVIQVLILSIKPNWYLILRVTAATCDKDCIKTSGILWMQSAKLRALSKHRPLASK